MRIYFIDFIDNQIKMIKNKRESNKRKKKKKKFRITSEAKNILRISLFSYNILLSLNMKFNYQKNNKKI